jgi:hypothetical protein
VLIPKFAMVQIRGVHPRNPITGETVPGLLQWFTLTEDMTDVLDPSKLYPRADIHHGRHEPIPMSEVVVRDDETLLRSIGMIG